MRGCARRPIRPIKPWRRSLDWRVRVATLPRLSRPAGAPLRVPRRLGGRHRRRPCRRALLGAAPPPRTAGSGSRAISASAVGVRGAPAAGPAASLDAPAAATGALYVLEGSTLGGQLIGRHIAGPARLLGATGCLLPGHGAAAGAMWAAFRTRLDAFGDDLAAEAGSTGGGGVDLRGDARVALPRPGDPGRPADRAQAPRARPAPPSGVPSAARRGARAAGRPAAPAGSRSGSQVRTAAARSADRRALAPGPDRRLRHRGPRRRSRSGPPCIPPSGRSRSHAGARESCLGGTPAPGSIRPAIRASRRDPRR